MNVALQAAKALGQGASTGGAIGAAAMRAQPGFVGLIVGGLFFSAKTGLDYRKYKKGHITKAEFKKRTKKGALATSSGMLGSAIGSVGGMILG